MKKNILRLLLFTLGYFITITIKAQGDTISAKKIKESIATFASLVDSLDLPGFGLKNMAELKSLKAGRQFKRCMIGLNDVKNYQ